MSELMDLSAYKNRTVDLEQARQLALTDVQSAVFKASTGAATPDDVQAAKEHLKAIEEQQRDLETLWAGTQVELAKQVDASRARDFAAFKEAVEAELAKRDLAVAAAVSATNSLVAALLQWREGTENIRDLTKSVHRYAGAGAQNAIVALDQSLSVRVAEEAMAAILNTEHVRLITAATLTEAFAGKSPEEYAAMISDRIRFALQRFEPAKISVS